jgi:hypothetical protein
MIHSIALYHAVKHYDGVAYTPIVSSPKRRLRLRRRAAAR